MRKGTHIVIDIQTKLEVHFVHHARRPEDLATGKLYIQFTLVILLLI